MTDNPRNDPNGVSVPFIFVGHGDPLPARWMAEHPGSLKVPAVMVPRGTRPSPTQGAAGAGAAAAALKPVPAAESRILGSFAPPPARRQCLPNGQPWPQDRNGRDWPKDRWGRPTRPLWDYPPGVRAPGEGVAPGAPGGIVEAEAIASARAALGALDPAILAGGRTGDGTGSTQTPPRGAASRYPGAYDVAEAGAGTVERDSPRGADQIAQRNPADPQDLWNPQAGSGYLNDPGNDWTTEKSKRECAAAVVRALHATGIDTRGHPVDAGQYGLFLQQHRFDAIPSLQGYTPQQGDVAVWQPPGGGIGHIEWFDGVRWHSDYIQSSPPVGPYATDQYGRGFSPGSKWTDVQVYRHHQ